MSATLNSGGGYSNRYPDVMSQSNNNSAMNNSGESSSFLPSSSSGQIVSRSPPTNVQKQQQQHIRMSAQQNRSLFSQQQQSQDLPYQNIQYQEQLPPPPQQQQQQPQSHGIHSHMQQHPSSSHHNSFAYERLPTAPIVPSTNSGGGPNYYSHERYSSAPSHQQQHFHHQHHHHHNSLQHQQVQQHTPPPRPQQRRKSVGMTVNATAAAAAAVAESSTSGRPYRSRKDRPCDNCRKRKSRCIIEESGQDCQSCRMNGRDCTFEMSPTPRSRPIKNEDGVTISSVIVPRKRSYSSQKGESVSPSDSGTVQNMANSHPASTTSEDSQQRKVKCILEQKKILSRQRSLSGKEELDTSEKNQEIATPKNFMNNLNNLMSPPSDPPSRSTNPQSNQTTMEEQSQDRVDMKKPIVKTKSDTLYDLVSAVMFKDDVNPISNVECKEGHDGIIGEQEEEHGKEMTTVVLGSSASEDPQLLYQAGSPGSTHMPSNNDHQSKSSSTMPPPLPPAVTEASSSQQPAPINNHTSSSSSSSSNNGHYNNNNMSPPTSYPLQVRQMNGDPYNPVFFAFVPAHPYGRSSKKTGSQIGEPGYTKLKEALGNRMGKLMVLYSQRDSAAFPILFESQRRKFRQSAMEALQPNSSNTVDVPLPLVLATATLATATVYDASLRSISKQAWGSNLHALLQQFEHSTLTTIQVALTDLTGRPSINTSGNIMTFNQTLAISHTLGLHLDPTNWTIPNEEKDVRVRLWWATMIHDKWSSLCWGRPSTIHTQDYTVPLPRNNGFSPCSEHLEDKDLKKHKFGPGWQTNVEDSHTPGDTFSGLCRLTLILSDILTEFHSVRGVHVMHRNSFTVSQKVKAYLVQLEDWMDLLPRTLKGVLKGETMKGCQGIPGTRSLQLSYLGVTLLLCRTLLDSVTTKGTQESERHVPAHKTGLHGCLMMIEYLESLDKTDYGGFFLHYGSHHIASCLSLLARLCYGFARLNEEDLLHTAIECMSRLLVTLSDAHRLYKWDLAELALTRSKAILPAMKASIPQWTKVFGESNLPVSGEDGEVEFHIGTKENGEQAGGDYSMKADARSGNVGKVLLRKEGGMLVGNDGEDGRTEVNNVSSPSSGIGAANNSSSKVNFRFGGIVGMPIATLNANAHAGLGNSVTENGAAANLHPFMGSGPYASIPIDAAGLPYPIGMNNSLIGSVGNGGTIPSPANGNGTTGASHLLSSMEVDWLALGLEPNTYSEYFVSSSFINHLGGGVGGNACSNTDGVSDSVSMGNGH